MDRGFLFGDAVYDTFPIYSGFAFNFDAHWERLQLSLANTRIQPDLDAAQMHAILKGLYEQNNGDNQVVYCQITRGVYPTRTLAMDPAISPTVFAMSKPLHHKSIDELAKGINVITLPDIRWHYSEIKNTSLLASVFLHQQIVRKNADEAILVRNGLALEGTISNLFIVKKNTLITPPLSSQLLSGTTRTMIIAIAKKELSLTIREEDIPEATLMSADEIWLTGTSREISPVIALNKMPIGTGQAGPIWHTMMQHFRDYRLTWIKEQT